FRIRLFSCGFPFLCGGATPDAFTFVGVGRVGRAGDHDGAAETSVGGDRAAGDRVLFALLARSRARARLFPRWLAAVRVSLDFDPRPVLVVVSIVPHRSHVIVRGGFRSRSSLSSSRLRRHSPQKLGNLPGPVIVTVSWHRSHVPTRGRVEALEALFA